MHVSFRISIHPAFTQWDEECEQKFKNAMIIEINIFFAFITFLHTLKRIRHCKLKKIWSTQPIYSLWLLSAHSETPGGPKEDFFYMLTSYAISEGPPPPTKFKFLTPQKIDWTPPLHHHHHHQKWKINKTNKTKIKQTKNNYTCNFNNVIINNSKRTT